MIHTPSLLQSIRPSILNRGKPLKTGKKTSSQKDGFLTGAIPPLPSKEEPCLTNRCNALHSYAYRVIIITYLLLLGIWEDVLILLVAFAFYQIPGSKRIKNGAEFSSGSEWINYGYLYFNRFSFHLRQFCRMLVLARGSSFLPSLSTHKQKHHPSFLSTESTMPLPCHAPPSSLRP